MQIKKKLYTTLIITILTMMVAIPMASAISAAPSLYVPATTPTTPLTSGPVGTKVEVVGVAGDASPFSTVTIYWDSLAGAVLGTGPADSTGAYMINVTIPEAVTGTHYLVANEGAGAMGATFDVTASLKASEKSALPSDSVTLTGMGFAASSSITVTLDSTTLATPVSITLTSPTITTNATGSFSAVIVIPTTIAEADFDTYTITADDGTSTASTTISIDYYITVTPPSGPTGITLTMAGRIPATTAYELRVDSTVVATGTSGADGTFSNTYTVPPLIALGGHTISVVWATVNTRTTTFTVTAAPTITYAPASGVAGATVTISGAGFSGNANITATLGTTTVNSTAMDSRFGPTDVTGAFTSEEFAVPVLAPGVYTLTVTDEYGATTGTMYTFTVLATPVSTVALRGTSYYRGDTLSFNIFTTDGFTAGPDVTIMDPSGATWWTGTWPLTASGPTWSVLYQDQLFGVDEPATLPADAPLGSWNWTIIYTPVSTGLSTKATGLFTVAATPSQQEVLDALNDMETTVEGLFTSNTGQITALINTKSGQIMTSLDALSPKLQGIEDTAVVIATMLGEVQVDLADLDVSALDTLGVSITAIKGDVATIKTNIGTVDTKVSNLDPVVGAIAGQLVEVQTSLGTLEGKITSVDGKVATVQTSVGTLQADISGVSGDVSDNLPVDMTAAWIAVVLSLIAAIAAIFAVITIRQKIAG